MGESDEINLLTDLKTTGVKLVKRGANKKPRFPIWKSEKKIMADFDEILTAVLEVEAEGEDRIEEIFKAELSPKGKNAVKGALRLLNAFKEELPKDIMSKLANLAGYGFPAPAEKQKGKKKEEEEEENMTKKSSSVTKALEGLPKEILEQLSPVLKSQEALHAEAISKAEERAKDAETRMVEIEKSLKKERDERELQEWIAKSEKELAYYPGKSSEELGTMLKKLHDTDPEVAMQQFETMKSASESISKSSLLRNSGASVDFSRPGTVMEAVKNRAKQVIQKSEKLMSKAEAYDYIFKNDPALYEQYKKELEEGV